METGFVDNMDAVRAQQMQRPQHNPAKEKHKQSLKIILSVVGSMDGA